MAIKFKRKDGTIRVIRNAEYLSGFYFIPKEFLDKCSAKIRSIPRRPRDLQPQRRPETAQANRESLRGMVGTGSGLLRALTEITVGALFAPKSR